MGYKIIYRINVILTLFIITSCDSKQPALRNITTNDKTSASIQIIQMAKDKSHDLAARKDTKDSTKVEAADKKQVAENVATLAASLTNRLSSGLSKRENDALKFINDPDGWKHLSNDKRIMKWAYDAFHTSARSCAIAPLLHLTNSQNLAVALDAYNLLGIGAFREGNHEKARTYFIESERRLGINNPQDRVNVGANLNPTEQFRLNSLWRSRAKLASECSKSDTYDNEVYWYELVLDTNLKYGADPEKISIPRAQLAYALMKSGEREKAIEQLTLATKADPNNCEWQTILRDWHKGGKSYIYESL